LRGTASPLAFLPPGYDDNDDDDDDDDDDEDDGGNQTPQRRLAFAPCSSATDVPLPWAGLLPSPFTATPGFEGASMGLTYWPPPPAVRQMPVGTEPHKLMPASVEFSCATPGVWFDDFFLGCPLDVGDFSSPAL
jgi:hypothetical protein